MPDFQQFDPLNAIVGGTSSLLTTTVPWGAFDDPDSPLRQTLPIEPGLLDCLRTTTDRLIKRIEFDVPWNAVMTAVAKAFCQVVDQQGQIARGIHLATARGVQLEQIGAAVGLPRNGLGDDLYELAIRARAASLLISGTGNELLALVRTLFPDAAAVTLEEWFPATIKICVPNLSADEFQLLLTILAPAPAAGVGAVLETFDPGTGAGWGYQFFNDVTPFGSFGYPGLTADESAGLFALWSYSATIGP